MSKLRTFFLFLAAACMAISSANASLIITGVVDGDLSGGNPKAIVFTATADIPDLSLFGFGSANNGGGTDDVEFAFSGMATAGDVLIATNNADNETFFACFEGLTIFNAGGSASINGDDAIELFDTVIGTTGLVIDTYGDVNVNGDGETWDYTDGYAVRTGGTAGAFMQSNYNSVFQGLDGLDAGGGNAEHKTAIANVFGFTVVPEPNAFILLAMAIVGFGFRNR